MMTVRDLIEQLAQLDPNLPVIDGDCYIAYSALPTTFTDANGDHDAVMIDFMDPDDE